MNLKHSLVLLLALVGVSAQAGGPSLEEADALFEKGEYQEALKKYDALAKAGDPDTQLKALYRAIESRALLFQYGEALERVEKRPKNLKGLWEARFNILQSEMSRQYLRQYGYAAQEDVEEGTTDVTRRAPAELHGSIQQAFSALYGQKESLAARPLSDESYFVVTKGIDAKRYPTLWDFALYSWTRYLLQEAPDANGTSGKRPAAGVFLGERLALDVPVADASLSSLGTTRLAGFLLDQPAGGKERVEAAEHWNVARLRIPFENPGKVRRSEHYPDDERTAIAQLRRWMESFTGRESRAEAGAYAAQLLNQTGDYSEAVELCKTVERRFPLTDGAKAAGRLRASIELPRLSLVGRAAPLSGAHAADLQVRNLPKIYLRLFRTTPEALRQTARYSQTSWCQAMSWIDADRLRGFLSEQPVRSWTVAVSTPPYQSASLPVDLPATEPGVYVLAASGDNAWTPGESLLTGGVVNLTRVALFGSSGIRGKETDYVWSPDAPAQREASLFRFYALDAQTGEPLDRVSVDSFLQKPNSGPQRQEPVALDMTGRGQLPMLPFDTRPGSWNYFQVDPLASRDGQYAWWAQAANWTFRSEAAVQLYLETDRPIYRPGQTVEVVVRGVKRIPQGYTTYDAGGAYVLRLTDMNGRQVAEKRLTPNALGTGATSFVIPAGRLLGRYALSASLEDKRYSGFGQASFAVEEYKRPEFEVTLRPAAGPWRVDQAVVVEGDAKYYFGGPVPDAPVSYRIYRERWAPDWFWWCRWWLGPYGGGREEVAAGQAKTDAKGHFSVPFTPQLPSGAGAYETTTRFVVEADARDAGGRTLKTSKSFTAGRSPISFQMTPSAGFFLAGRRGDVTLRALSLDGDPVASDVTWRLTRFEKDPADVDVTAGTNGTFAAAGSLDQMFASLSSGPVVQQGRLSCAKDKPATLSLKSLPAGVYRLNLSARDAWGTPVEQSIVLCWADPQKGVPLRIPSITIAEHADYAPGEVARFLLGASALTGAIHVEAWHGDYLMEQEMLKGGGTRVVEWKVPNDFRGGLTLRWFGIRDYQARGGEATVQWPWREKNLSIDWAKFDASLLPGATAHWSLKVRDASGRPVDGEARVSMFDRSLEYYAAADFQSLSGLYAPKEGPNPARHSRVASTTAEIPVDKGWVAKLLGAFREYQREPEPPSLRSTGSQYMLKRRRGWAMSAPMNSDKVELMESMLKAPGAAPGRLAIAKKDGLEREGTVTGQDLKIAAAEPAPPPPAVRSNFAETAFFRPQLPVKGGQASWSFVVPDQLTSWKASANVITKDVKTGLVTRETVTRKDLMVRVEMPRFFRESDQGTLKVVVHNETDGRLPVGVTLTVEGPRAAALLGESSGADTVESRRDLSVDAHGVKAYAWNVHVPKGLATFKARAVVRSGNWVDAEERVLPILPSRQRLVESAVVTLDGSQTKILKAPGFSKPDPTRENEAMTLQIDPQLALVILNSLPFLVEYPHECVEQTLNRFVPMAIMNQVYKKYPAIAKAAAKIPKRSSVTPAWDRSDPRRLMTLMETPWIGASEGVRSGLPVYDMMDAALVAAQQRDALEKLQAAQLPSGGFPWFPGGHENPYMTLYVLAGFAEAQRYGVAIPEEMIRRALGYVNNEIPRHLTPEVGDVATMLYAAYVVTSFGDRFPEAQQGFTFAKAWMDFADGHRDALTPLGKAQAAYVYYRLGEKAKGEQFLDRALDGAREEPTAGVYWTPEKNSWLWYSDTVEKHAFFVRTLQKWRPSDRRLPGMVQWLIFNRKGNVWKSTKASAEAIYALLDVLQARGALEHGDRYQVTWGALKDEVAVGPADWLEKPIRWEKKGRDIDTASGAATIVKKGPGIAFGALTWIYSTDQLPEASNEGLLNVKRTFFRRVKEGDAYHLKPLKSGDPVAVGDEIEVHLAVATKSQFEYVHLQDPKAAGFEAEQLTSGWKWDQLGRYEEPRDSLTNFFMDWLPHGEYVLRYRLRPTTAGTYRIGAATLQSMYAPEFTAHSDGMVLRVTDR